VHVWDFPARKELLRLKGHTGPVLAAAFAPDCRRIASVSSDGTLRIWMIEPLRIWVMEVMPAGKQLRCIKLPAKTEALAWCHEGRGLLSAGADGVVRLWEAATGKELKQLTGHTGPLHCVAVSPDGKYALSGGGGDNALRLWDLRALAPPGGGVLAK
jgi:WD40 repeat protein